MVSQEPFSYHISRNDSVYADTVHIEKVTDCSIETLVFPEAIEGCTRFSICKNAFANCPRLKKIVFPQGLAAIDDYAFSHCEKLEEISFGRIRKLFLGKYVFEGCTRVKSVTIDIALLNEFGRLFSEPFNSTPSRPWSSYMRPDDSSSAHRPYVLSLDEKTIISLQGENDDGVMYPTLFEIHGGEYEDKDGYSHFTIWQTIWGFVPKSLEVIRLYVTGDKPPTESKRKDWTYFSTLKRIDVLDPVGNESILPIVGDNAIYRWPRGRSILVPMERYRRGTFGQVNIVAGEETYGGTFHESSFESLSFDKGSRLLDPHLVSVSVHGLCSIRSPISELEMVACKFRTEVLLPDTLRSLKIYKSSFGSTLALPGSLENLEISSMKMSDADNEIAADEKSANGDYPLTISWPNSLKTLSINESTFGAKFTLPDSLEELSIESCDLSNVTGGTNANAIRLRRCTNIEGFLLGTKAKSVRIAGNPRSPLVIHELPAESEDITLNYVKIATTRFGNNRLQRLSIELLCNESLTIENEYIDYLRLRPETYWPKRPRDPIPEGLAHLKILDLSKVRYVGHLSIGDFPYLEKVLMPKEVGEMPYPTGHYNLIYQKG